MAIVTLKNIRKEYAGRQVLDDISFEINANQKIGLIGLNGSGKTTILRILSGLERPDAGKIDLSVDLRIGYVPQHVEFTDDETVIQWLSRRHEALARTLRQKEHAVANHKEDDNVERLLHEYQQVRDMYDRQGGDHFQRRAESILQALGISQRNDQPVSQLSGGEQNVLAMAQALLNEPNLLILDEPGNHLDYEALDWLDHFLQRFRGALLIVSHNRYLLDRVVGDIIELESGKIKHYPGNYSAYQHIRQEQLRAQQSQYNAYQQRLSHLEALVQKFADIAQGHASDQSWGKKLRSRRSQLERLKSQQVEKPVDKQPDIKLRFKTDPTRADIALQLRGYSKSFDSLQLFDKVDWNICGSQRWALIGPNGCGKTTLLRDIIDNASWEHPVIRIGPSLTVGYCAQQQEILDNNNTVFDELLSTKNISTQQVLTILARLLFKDEEIHKKISNLSGGERNRLQLARIMLLQPNFLILDEPTNHLDIPTREAVEQALGDFVGTILVVSHDRYFLDKIIDHVAEVYQMKLHIYTGNFTSFWEKRHQADTSDTSTAGRITTRGKNRRRDNEDKTTAGQSWLQRKSEAATRRKAAKTLQQVERQIADTEKEKKLLEQQITAAFTDGDHQQGQTLSKQLKTITGQLEALYEDWTAAGELLDRIDQQSYNNLHDL